MILASLARYYRRLAEENDEMATRKCRLMVLARRKSAGFWYWIKEGRLKTVVPNLTVDKKAAAKADERAAP